MSGQRPAVLFTTMTQLSAWTATLWQPVATPGQADGRTTSEAFEKRALPPQEHDKKKCISTFTSAGHRCWHVLPRDKERLRVAVHLCC